MFYRRLSLVTREEEVSEIGEELTDRFGPLPPDARRLLEIVRFKIRLAARGVLSLHGKADEIVVGFSEKSDLDRLRLVSLLQEDPGRYKMAPSQKLIIRTKMPKAFDAYLRKLDSVLMQFMVCDKKSKESETVRMEV